MNRGRQPPTSEGYRGDWATPQQFVDAIAQMLDIERFDLDVCATRATSKANDYLGPDHEDPQYRDGTKCCWERWNWCNPPFDHETVFNFARAAVWQVSENGFKTAMLLPVTKQEVEAFHWLLDQQVIEGIIFTRGRLAFEFQGDVSKLRGGSPNHGSMVLIIGPNCGGRPPAIGTIQRTERGGPWVGRWM